MIGGGGQAPMPMAAPPLAGGMANGTALPNAGSLIQPVPPQNNFIDATSGIRSIAENIAAGFSKDPARRAQYQQQLQQEDAQRQNELQMLRQQQIHYMDQMQQLALAGGLTPAIAQHTQAASKSIDQLFGPGTSQQWQGMLQSADAAYKAQAAQKESFTLGEGQQRFGPDGKPVAAVPPKSDVLSPEAFAQKEALAQAGKTAISIDARPVSDAQAKALGFGDRMSAANDTIEGLNYTPSTVGNAVSSLPVIGNALTSEQHQQFNQAKLDFMSADLRKESGAVISPEEYAAEDAKFFPQPNDKPETIKQKAEARKRVILNTYREGRNVTGTEAGKTAAAGTKKSKPRVLKYDPANDTLSPVE